MFKICFKINKIDQTDRSVLTLTKKKRKGKVAVGREEEEESRSGQSQLKKKLAKARKHKGRKFSFAVEKIERIVEIEIGWLLSCPIHYFTNLLIRYFVDETAHG